MTRFERAAQIWPVLTISASQRHLLTYEILARVTGMPRQGLGALLEPIQSYCLINKLPALSSLVVGVKTGIPGEGFIAAEDVPAEQAAVFTWPWFERKPPTAAELAAATERLPSNGKSIELLKQELKG
jgi:hypothetical protein